jgi:hypothetical protein
MCVYVGGGVSVRVRGVWVGGGAVVAVWGGVGVGVDGCFFPPKRMVTTTITQTFQHSAIHSFIHSSIVGSSCSHIHTHISILPLEATGPLCAHTHITPPLSMYIHMSIYTYTHIYLSICPSHRLRQRAPAGVRVRFKIPNTLSCCFIVCMYVCILHFVCVYA